MNFSGQYKISTYPVEHSYNSDPLYVHQFDSGQDGQHFLILSGIHAGTESIPTAATYTAIDMIKDGMLPLTKGKITLIPLCNPLALKQGKRAVDINLNRVMSKHSAPTHYEHYLANIITDFIDKADSVIDLHTQSTQSEPYVFNDFPELSSDLAHALGIKKIITGWPEAFAANETLFNENDTSSYAYEQNIPAVCVECGYNKDPMAAAIALKAIIMGMRFCDITDHVYDRPRNFTTVRIKEGVSMLENAEFSKAFHNFEAVAKDDVILKDKNTDKALATAPADGMVILPKLWAEPGMEAYFFAQEE